jgi:hypothetical protein
MMVVVVTTTTTMMMLMMVAGFGSVRAGPTDLRVFLRADGAAAALLGRRAAPPPRLPLRPGEHTPPLGYTLSIQQPVMWCAEHQPVTKLVCSNRAQDVCTVRDRLVCVPLTCLLVSPRSVTWRVASC